MKGKSTYILRVVVETKQGSKEADTTNAYQGYLQWIIVNFKYIHIIFMSKLIFLGNYVSKRKEFIMYFLLVFLRGIISCLVAPLCTGRPV